MTFPTAGFITQNHLNDIAVTHYPKVQQLKTIVHSSLKVSVMSGLGTLFHVYFATVPRITEEPPSRALTVAESVGIKALKGVALVSKCTSPEVFNCNF